MATAIKTTSFLDLPRELRDEIYKFAVLPASDTVLKSCYYHKPAASLGLAEPGFLFAKPTRSTLAGMPAAPKPFAPNGIKTPPFPPSGLQQRIRSAQEPTDKLLTFASLARACKQINEEVTPLLYQQMLFSFEERTSLAPSTPSMRLVSLDDTFRCMQRIRTKFEFTQRSRQGFVQKTNFTLELTRAKDGQWSAVWVQRPQTMKFGQGYAGNTTKMPQRFHEMDVSAPSMLEELIGSSDMSSAGMQVVWESVESMYEDAVQEGLWRGGKRRAI